MTQKILAVYGEVTMKVQKYQKLFAEFCDRGFLLNDVLQ